MRSGLQLPRKMFHRPILLPPAPPKKTIKATVAQEVSIRENRLGVGKSLGMGIGEQMQGGRGRCIGCRTPRSWRAVQSSNLALIYQTFFQFSPKVTHEHIGGGLAKILSRQQHKVLLAALSVYS